MKYKLFIIFISAIFLLATAGYTEENNKQITLENVVVTPLKVKQGIGETSTSVSTLNGKKLQKEGITTLKEAVKKVSGIDLSSEGSHTGTTSIFIRGANTNHTSLVIDGIKLYDPIVTTSYYNFAHLSLDNIRKVEVAKGPQSALYGSDSIGGLINMTTQKGRGKPTLMLSSSVGSFETFREEINYSGQKDKFHYSLSATREDSDGFSAADESDGNDEKDGYQRTYTSWRFDYDVNKDTTVGTTGRYTHTRYEYDKGFPVQDDEDRIGWYDEGILSMYVKQKLNNIWNYRVNFGGTKIYRKNKDDTDDIDRFYDGRTYQLNLQNNFKITNINTLVAGFDYLKEIGDSNSMEEVDAHTKGYFIEDVINFPWGLNLSGSLRLEDHSTFGDHTTYKLGANYKFKQTGTRLKATFGTGFNAPGLYQLYSSSGNIDLDPEESESYDVGIEQMFLNDRIKLNSTYFHTHISDMIEWVSTGLWTGEYKNVGSAHIEGIENSIDYRIKDNFKLTGSYTHTRPIDNEEDKGLERRADNKFSIGLDYSPFKEWKIGLNIRYTGTRRDGTTKLDEFTVVDVNTQYDLNESTQIFGRIDNLFDKDYELVEGYQTTPFSVHVGIRKTF